MSGGGKWGLVATIKAPAAQVLAFAAHHLDLGAHRLFLYLDDENQAAFDALAAHPKCRPVLTDAAYWAKLGMKRRVKHQARQTENARHAYGRAAGQVAWLAHIDVDEYLTPLPGAAPLGQQLAALPPSCLSARIRPAEALAQPPAQPASQPTAQPAAQPVTHFKMLHPDRATRDRYARALWPDYGAHLNGGFLSHVAGKLIYRTGVTGLRVQIHNIFVHDQNFCARSNEPRRGATARCAAAALPRPQLAGVLAAFHLSPRQRLVSRRAAPRPARRAYPAPAFCLSPRYRGPARLAAVFHPSVHRNPRPVAGPRPARLAL